eukprot:scaffold434_cov186-Pinguiococcus_pyrenoidosus.AAC.125
MMVKDVEEMLTNLFGSSQDRRETMTPACLRTASSTPVRHWAPTKNPYAASRGGVSRRLHRLADVGSGDFTVEQEALHVCPCRLKVPNVCA